MGIGQLRTVVIHCLDPAPLAEFCFVHITGSTGP